MKDLVERHYESNEITTNALGALKNLSSIEGISKEQMGDRQRQLVSTLPIMMERLERASIVNIKVKALAYVTNLSYDEACHIASLLPRPRLLESLEHTRAAPATTVRTVLESPHRV